MIIAVLCPSCKVKVYKKTNVCEAISTLLSQISIASAKPLV